MRNAVIGAVVLVVIGAGGWIWGESRLADRTRVWIAADPALAAAAVEPLRDPRRFGLRLSEPQLSDPALRLSLPWAEALVSPLAPTTAQLDLPQQGQLVLAGQAHDLTLQSSEARLRLAPLNRMAPDQLILTAQWLALDGQPLADSLSVEARLGRLAASAPMEARTAYDIDLKAAGVQLQVLARAGLDAGQLPDPVAIDGQLRLWLDRTPDAEVPPQIVGWQTPSLVLEAGPIKVRVVGRVIRDAGGLAEGQVVLYSRNADQMLDLAADMGLIPRQVRLLLRAGLAQLSQVAPEAALPGPAYPEPQEGELRLPILMRDGQLILAGVPVGPAPAFAGLAVR
nr:DUF2125 domain-containing protein [Paracoccus saliphilus]